MDEIEEIEVEVVEMEVKERSSRPRDPGSPDQNATADRPRSPFSGRFTINSKRIPGYLWPLAFILGLILLLLAVVVGIVIAIPLLILRAILRLFR